MKLNVINYFITKKISLQYVVSYIVLISDDLLL